MMEISWDIPLPALPVALSLAVSALQALEIAPFASRLVRRVGLRRSLALDLY